MTPRAALAALVALTLAPASAAAHTVTGLVAAWVLAAGAGGAAALRIGLGRRAPRVLVGALALAVVTLSYGESRATGARPWERSSPSRWPSQASRPRCACGATPRSRWTPWP